MGIKCLILYSVPMTREHLLDIMSACFFHVIWESSVNPKKLKHSTLSITKLSILIVRLIFLVVFFLNIICLDFLKLRDSIFIFSHSFILESSLLILV